MNNIKKVLNKVEGLKYSVEFNRFCMYAAVGLFAALILTEPVYAADKVDKLTETIADYAKKGGGIVTFYGAIQTAMGLKQDDPEAKTKGTKTALAGAAVYAVSKGYSTWID